MDTKRRYRYQHNLIEVDRRDEGDLFDPVYERCEDLEYAGRIRREDLWDWDRLDWLYTRQYETTRPRTWVPITFVGVTDLRDRETI